MNPADKYLNPRAPPRPKLPRLATSPATFKLHSPLPSPLSAPPSRPAHGRSASYPRDAAPRKRFRIPGKISLESKPASPTSSKPSALRSAFLNFNSPRSASGGQTTHTSRSKEQASNTERFYRRPASPPPMHHCLVSVDQVDKSCHSGQNSRRHSPNNSPVDPTRLAPPEMYSQRPLLTAHHRRRDYPGLRSPPSAPLKTSIGRTKSPGNHPAPEHGQFPAIQPSNDPKDPTMLVTCKLDVSCSSNALPSPVDLYSKRLPTLPNSPSSVLDEFASPIAVEQKHLDLNLLQSHFSQTTVGSPNQSPNSFLYPSESRFSECSTDTDMVSPCSMTSFSTFNNGSNTSSTLDSSPDQSPAMHQGEFTNINAGKAELGINPYDDSCPATPSAANSLHVSGLNISGGFDCEGSDLDKWQPDWHLSLPWEKESTPKSHQLPSSEHGCSDELYPLSTPRAINDKQKYSNRAEVDEDDAQQSSLRLQNMVQEFIDEISYLRGAID